MKFDLYPGQGLSLQDAARTASLAERSGFDGLWSLEAAAEPFLPLVLAAEHTKRLELRTSIAVALARSPMVVAHIAHELNRYSEGRFQLGLGSQVKAHIQRRFSQPWSDPVGRMEEYIAAVRAIWRCWNTGEELDFHGHYYTHTLMTPMFSPPPCPQGSADVHLAAVGPKMIAMAARSADGIVVHPLSSPRVIEESVLPIVRRERDSFDVAGDFELACPVMVVTGSDEQEIDFAREAVRKQVAFYASTPAYRSVFETYDEGERADRLRLMSREGRWDDMTALITDELLAEFSVEAVPGDLAGVLSHRFGSLLQRVGMYAPYELSADTWQLVAEGRVHRGN